MLAATSVASFCFAQSYTFKADVMPYEEITDRSMEDTTLDNYYQFQSTLPVKIFGKRVDVNFTAGTSAAYLIAGNDSFSYAMDPLVSTWFQKIPAKSRLNITTVATASDTQLVVQWKDMGFYGHPGTEYINCQVRISKVTGMIIFHYGKSTYVRMANDSAFSDPQYTGPEILLVKLNPDFTKVIEFNTVAGDPAAPYFTTQFKRMTGLPIENQRFVFTPKTPVSVAKVSETDRMMRVYPNPTNGQSITIEAPEILKSITVKNMLGQILHLGASGLGTKQAEVTLGNTIQPLLLEITLANGETIVRKITTGN